MCRSKYRTNSAGGFDAVLFSDINTYFEDNVNDWKNYPSKLLRSFKYDDGLGDYHIWQSRYGGQESVRYNFGLNTLFGHWNTNNRPTIQDTEVKINGSGDINAPS